MRRFFYLFGLGILTSIIFCVALTVLWYALCLICFIPIVHWLIFNTFFGQVIGFYLYGLYYFYALSIPAGQIYSFGFYCRKIRKC